MSFRFNSDEKLHVLTVNNKEVSLGSDRISAGALKQQLSAPSRYWVFAHKDWGEPDQLDDDDEIDLNEVDSVSIIPPHKRGLFWLSKEEQAHWLFAKQPAITQNAELKRLRERLQMETAYLRGLHTYGKVGFEIAKDGSEAFVNVPRLFIGYQWSKPVTDIFIKIPTQSPGYPILTLDSFFVSIDLRTLLGQKPKHLWIEGNYDWLDKRFLTDGYAQFSFHLETWQPVYSTRTKQFTEGDSLVSYLAAIVTMFQQPVEVV